MSIYFQYPAIDEYPKLIYPLQTETDEPSFAKDEDSLNKDQILELSDYLTLKQL
ncbi:hypothetical protein H9N25_09280 [Pedobacter riviphilus]|uniref:Uncharacterized protein n=1 Tax=Pedobacter riviphilus TaxID=2766984 RepID=A0ABX6TNX1_9SPHI|nr:MULTISPECIES: hypothetical protein [Pedobacter]NII82872.1 hypothetical protein [Pedobacter sp. SG908]NMN36890.1 hypothetical protein [Pedobacter sp. SG918]QNR86560.1 hypothetical protein H9N25_09280 [Pedobacter riviphilus]